MSSNNQLNKNQGKYVMQEKEESNLFSIFKGFLLGDEKSNGNI